MKKSRKLATLGICSALFLGLAACQQQHVTSEGTNQRQSSSAKVPWKASYTNLNNQVSTEEVKSLLSAHLDPNSVDAFFNLVNDYNTIVGSTGLSGDFTSFTHLTPNTMLRKSVISGIKRRAISLGPTAVSIVIVF